MRSNSYTSSISPYSKKQSKPERAQGFLLHRVESQQ